MCRRFLDTIFLRKAFPEKDTVYLEAYVAPVYIIQN